MFRWRSLCVSPQFVAEDLLKIEGFTDVQYVETPDGGGAERALASGEVDINNQYSAPLIVRIDAGAPVVFLGGLHVGCFEFFAKSDIKTIRDFKGKVVAVPELGSVQHVFVSTIAANVGLDPRKDVQFAAMVPAEGIRRLTEGTIDAFLGFPPDPLELRRRNVGHVLLNSSVDRPWSQYFCCMVAGNRDFVRKHPVATKRALRALLKANQICALEPERSAPARRRRGVRRLPDGRVGTRTVRLHPADTEVDPVRQVARVRSGGHHQVLRAQAPRGGHDRVDTPEDPGPGHRLALSQRIEEGAEGMISRREFVGALAGTAGLAGLGARPAAAEAPPETLKLRLAWTGSTCQASQYVAEELLKLEGFREVEFPDLSEGGGIGVARSLAAGRADLTMNFVGPLVLEVDAGSPLVLLAGGHVGCFELIGTERVRAIRDLKGRTVAVADPVTTFIFLDSLVGYVGLDPRKDMKTVFHPADEAIKLLAEGRIDAYLAFPPATQELRARKIGHVVVATVTDRPWSQYFCCMLAGNREFVRRHPVATKRAMRAILKSADICALEPERAARALVARVTPSSTSTRSSSCATSPTGSGASTIPRTRSASTVSGCTRRV